MEFNFSKEQLQSQKLLKDAVAKHPCTRPINYNSEATVILASDACPIVLSFYICQCDENDPKKCYYCHFGSITLNKCESCFSQAKLKIFFSLYRAFQEFKMYLLRIRNLVVEVDMHYIKGMLQNPDIAPSASVNWWILTILMFQFNLIHVPAMHHGPNGLSQRPQQLSNEICDEEALDDEFGDWIDGLYGFMHTINPSPLVDIASHSNGLATIATFVKFFVPMGSDSVEQSNGIVEVFAQSVGIFLNVSDDDQLSYYSKVLRSEAAKHKEAQLDMVKQYLDDLKWPPDLDNKAFNSFIRYVLHFLSKNLKLW